MKKKIRTTEEILKIYKRRFFILLSLFSVLLVFAAVFIYVNYDYLAFKYFFCQNYIYTADMDKFFKNELKKDVKGNYFKYFDDAVISVVTRNIRGINNDRYTYLYIPEQYQKYKQQQKASADQSEIRSLDSSTVYLHLTNFSTYTRDFVEGKLDELKKYKNIVIDLRDNPGGETESMNAIAGFFLPKGSIITTDRLRYLDWVYKSKGQKLTFKKIAILQNKNSASCSECMIAALRENLKNVVTIGETSFGKGIGQYTLDLKEGFAVKATIMYWNTPKGTNIQGKGIIPDISYSGDDMINFALKTVTAGM